MMKFVVSKNKKTTIDDDEKQNQTLLDGKENVEQNSQAETYMLKSVSYIDIANTSVLEDETNNTMLSDKPHSDIPHINPEIHALEESAENYLRIANPSDKKLGGPQFNTSMIKDEILHNSQMPRDLTQNEDGFRLMQRTKDHIINHDLEKIEEITMLLGDKAYPKTTTEPKSLEIENNKNEKGSTTDVKSNQFAIEITNSTDSTYFDKVDKEKHSSVGKICINCYYPIQFVFFSIYAWIMTVYICFIIDYFLDSSSIVIEHFYVTLYYLLVAISLLPIFCCYESRIFVIVMFLSSLLCITLIVFVEIAIYAYDFGGIYTILRLIRKISDLN